MTRQREIVLEVMHHFPKPATAQMILHSAQDHDKSFDLTTVYRTLELFERFGLIVSFDGGHKGRRYLHIGENKRQPQLICRSCGAVIVLETKDLEKAIRQGGQTTGWRVDLSAAALTGLCPSCKGDV
jgi:Fe2+ or Zn2+ uptake regulation protein